MASEGHYVPFQGRGHYIVQLLKTDTTTPLKSVWRSLVSTLGEILLLEGHYQLYYLGPAPQVHLREGVQKKISGKVWSFTKPPSDPPPPPPGLVFFPKKKFTPIFFLKIASSLAETNFTPKKNFNFFSGKKTIPGGGSEGGLVKDHTFYGYFFRQPSLTMQR